jgi:hypothetical protein
MLRKQFSDPSKTVARVKGVSVPRDAWIEYEYNNRPSFGVQNQYAIKISAAYGVTIGERPKIESVEKDSVSEKIGKAAAIVVTQQDLAVTKGAIAATAGEVEKPSPTLLERLEAQEPEKKRE